MREVLLAVNRFFSSILTNKSGINRTLDQWEDQTEKDHTVDQWPYQCSNVSVHPWQCRLLTNAKTKQPHANLFDTEYSLYKHMFHWSRAPLQKKASKLFCNVWLPTDSGSHFMLLSHLQHNTGLQHTGPWPGVVYFLCMIVRGWMPCLLQGLVYNF